MTAPDERAALIEAIRSGWTNTPFSRCSFCGKDWNGGAGHDHPDRDPMDWVYEEKGGTIAFDCEKAADAVLAIHARRLEEARADYRTLKSNYDVLKGWYDDVNAEVLRLRARLTPTSQAAREETK